VPTFAFQVWMKPDRDALGWSNHCESDEGHVQGTYVEPIDTYADMSHLLDKESWPSSQVPRHLAYFCGPLEDASGPLLDDADFPLWERRRVRSMIEEFFTRDAAYLWPRAVKPGTSELDWGLMIDPLERAGSSRLDGQYYRANVEPTERYVLSVKGSTRYRLAPDESGVKNLFLCGDWTKNTFSVGCIEAAALSGVLCARAVAARAAVADEPTPRRRSRRDALLSGLRKMISVVPAGALP
jgi:uncharacterized protein with NAD-binding domain and iron-sulfur cluster